jgi:hypothetical protein
MPLAETHQARRQSIRVVRSTKGSAVLLSMSHLDSLRWLTVCLVGSPSQPCTVRSLFIGAYVLGLYGFLGRIFNRTISRTNP